MDNNPNASKKEEQDNTARVGDEERKDVFIERNGERFAGTHLIVDLWGAERIDDLAYVEDTLRECVEAAKATLLHIHLHHSRRTTVFPAWRCWRSRTSRSTPGRNPAMPRSTSSCAARPKIGRAQSELPSLMPSS